MTVTIQTFDQLCMQPTPCGEILSQQGAVHLVRMQAITAQNGRILKLCKSRDEAVAFIENRGLTLAS